MKQLRLLANEKSAYGGDLRRDRTQRGARPLSTRDSMHIVLRSSQAKGAQSFLRQGKRVVRIIEKFALKYGIKIHNVANVGNHLHLHVKLGNRHTYAPFIRAITAAIAMAVTGRSRWSKVETPSEKNVARFWDYRPFTRVVVSLKAFLNLRDYIRINRLEGGGMSRVEAFLMIKNSPPKTTRSSSG